MTPIALTRLFALKRTAVLSASRLPSLRRLLGDVSEDEFDFDALRRLPLTDKQSFVAQSQEWLEVNEELPDFVVSSGGTTGDPTVIWGYVWAMTRRQDPLPGGKLRPLVLRPTSGRQGEAPHFPAHHGALEVPLRDPSGYRLCVNLLQKKFRFKGYEPRISVALLPLQAAKKLAHVLLTRNIGSDQLALRQLHTYASYLSAQWRSRLSDTLGVQVVDHYGFSEMSEANAAACPHCAHYHFSEATVWELLSSAGTTVTRTGQAGQLVVTRLLSQEDRLQPILRFETGDVCQLGPFCTTAGEPGFKPVGKRDHCVRLTQADGQDLYPVRYGDIQEALDCSPLVARIANTRHAGVTPTEGDAFAKWRLISAPSDQSSGPRRARLEIEMNFDPRLFSDAWFTFEAQVRARIAATADHAKAVSELGFELEVAGLPPGSMTDSDVMRS